MELYMYNSISIHERDTHGFSRFSWSTLDPIQEIKFPRPAVYIYIISVREITRSTLHLHTGVARSVNQYCLYVSWDMITKKLFYILLRRKHVFLNIKFPKKKYDLQLI